MVQLSNRIENALNEARILLLGSQVFLGFLLRAYFEPGFNRLPHAAAISLSAATLLTTASVGLLVWPAAYHQIAEYGEETAYTATFTSTVLDWVLMPVAVAFGTSLYVVAREMRISHAAAIAVLSILVALGAWYMLALVRHDPKVREKVRRDTENQEDENAKQGKTELPQRIRNVLTECRMALPGAQALLGFQFIDVFFDSFVKLPRALQWIHFASLLCTMLATILLIAPAAYHRIAEGGEDTEHFLKVASRMLLLALVFLAPGMTGDIVVVLSRVTHSLLPGIILSVGLLLVFYALWFGYSAWARARR
jgi:hypothetical protein